MNAGSYEITAKVTLGKADGGYQLAVELTGHLKDVDRTTAERLMEAAHAVCPYSRATRGNIEVQLKVA